MDGGLGQHGVVLELRLPQRRGVASNDDELGLSRAEALEGGLVSESDPAKVSDGAHGEGARCQRTCQTS